MDWFLISWTWGEIIDAHLVYHYHIYYSLSFFFGGGGYPHNKWSKLSPHFLSSGPQNVIIRHISHIKRLIGVEQLSNILFDEYQSMSYYLNCCSNSVYLPSQLPNNWHKSPFVYWIGGLGLVWWERDYGLEVNFFVLSTNEYQSIFMLNKQSLSQC